MNTELLIFIISFAIIVTIQIVKLFRMSTEYTTLSSEKDFLRTKDYEVFKIIEQDLIDNRNQYTSLWSSGGGMNRSVQRKGNYNGYLTILIMEDGLIILPVDMTNQPRKYKDIIKKHVDEIYRADLNKIKKMLQDEKY